MAEYFVKLESSILRSTLWDAPDATRIVWITMLALSDEDGHVWGSVPGLAHEARVSLEACQAALEYFKRPDPYSRTKDCEGRRIEEIDRGWLLINYRKKRESRDDISQRERHARNQASYRERQKAPNVTEAGHVTGHAVTPGHTRSRDGHVTKRDLNREVEGEVQIQNTNTESLAIQTLSTPPENSGNTHTCPIASDESDHKPPIGGDSLKPAPTEIPKKPTPVEAIYDVYPRKIAPRKAKEAIERAITRLADEAEGQKFASRIAAEKWLYRTVKAFAGSPAGQSGKFTPHPTTWFNQSRYLDDQTQWQITGGDAENAAAERTAAAIQQPSRGELEALRRERENQELLDEMHGNTGRSGSLALVTGGGIGGAKTGQAVLEGVKAVSDVGVGRDSA